MKKIIHVVLMLVLLTSCISTIENTFGDVEMGLPYEEVIDMCGNPAGIYTAENGNLRIEYYGYSIRGIGHDRGDFFIEFNEGKVVGYGVINSRTQSVSTSVSTQTVVV